LWNRAAWIQEPHDLLIKVELGEKVDNTSTEIETIFIET
jgi:hypothetical protein